MILTALRERAWSHETSRNFIALCFVTAGIAVLYLPTFGHAMEVWQGDPELSFGYFGLPGAAVLVLGRRRELASAWSSGSNLSLAVFLLGLLTLVFGHATGVHAIAGLSLLPTAIGAAAYLGGLRFAALLGLPLAMLTATMSLYRGLLSPLGFWLQRVTAVGAADTANALGTHVYRNGVDLFVGNAHFVVAEACSGMNSLLALLFLGLLVGAFAIRRWPTRALLLVTILPIVLIANTIRVTVVLVTSGVADWNLESGISHEFLSAGMFLLAGLALLLVATMSGGLRSQPA